METKTHSKVYPLAMTAVMASVMAVTAPFAIPIGPISLTLCTLIIYLNAYLLGWKRGTAATAVYILLGVVGMPVFSGFGSGLAQVAGPTGGYILGYLPLAVIAGLAADHFPQNRPVQLAGMVLGTAVLYGLGTAWYCYQSGAALGTALGWCVIPFLPGDTLKILAAMLLGPLLRSRLRKAGIDPED